MSCTFSVGATSGSTHLCPPVPQPLVLFFKARWQSLVLLALPNAAKFWYHDINFPADSKRAFRCVFLFWSPALDGCHTLPPAFKPSCVLALTSMPWGSQELSKGWRSSWQCSGGFGGLGSVFGVLVPLVWWPGELAAGICSWMASARHWEHSRQRQGLINTLNHLCFDLSPDS